MKKVLIALENGYTDTGYAFAGEGTIFAEFVFNTAMTGYQEILTDPSYKGQVVLFTYPLIGNYGINDNDSQSNNINAEAIIVRENSRVHSNYKSVSSLKEFLETQGKIGVEGVDTRALTKQIREQGAMKGGITTEDISPEEFLIKVKSSTSISNDNVYEEVILDKVTKYDGNPEGNYTILAIDFGVKSNIIEDLSRYYKTIYLVPFDDNFEENIKSLQFDGVFLSNGPGDPRIVSEINKYLLEFAKAKTPIIGICFGHQLIGQAFGIDTYKMPFGHHGGNHPVLYHPTGKVFITSQNHNYALQKDKLVNNPDWEITWENLFDNTVAGIRHKSLPISSVQYHPEASPGPNESNKQVFDDFFEIVDSANKS
ncbi:glutamine-hydrolyzing carbamoyl-phosphate synthase small subunit [Candidatus Kapabacteria bacterium]|nr:glutamine-hydrolyzing carbamoyl-phosphate synthase small subunit [Candidatus Kapabacteria bacterium]